MILPMGNDFVSWVEGEIKARGWSQSDLSRKSGITTAQISRVLNRERMPGIEFCKGIARAFELKDIQVLELAGLATDSEPSKFSPIVEAAATMLNQLPEDDQEEIRAMVRLKYERAQRKKPKAAGAKP
jgi:transcriptional regulator with XRE-family HTH domain